MKENIKCAYNRLETNQFQTIMHDIHPSIKFVLLHVLYDMPEYKLSQRYTYPISLWNTSRYGENLIHSKVADLQAQKLILQRVSSLLICTF